MTTLADEPIALNAAPSPNRGRVRGFSLRRSARRDPETVVVIGNGMASFKFGEALLARSRPAQFRLVVFGEEKWPAYDRVHLTRYFSDQAPQSLLLAPREWYEDRGIELHLGNPVHSIDRERRLVRSASGPEVQYDRLVFATGSRPWRPSVEGTDLPGVFVYRTLDDLQRIEAHAAFCRRAAVLGGGLLGLEVAKALQDFGLATWVVERGTGLLARQLDPKASALLQKHVEKLGIVPLLGRETARIEAAGEDRLLHFSSNEMLRVQLVVLAAGVRPRDELAAACGLKIAPRGGIEVNAFLESSDPRIYAIGECASHRGTCYGLAAPAYQMADALAQSFSGARKPFTSASLSTRLKLPGIEVTTLGEFQAEGETLVRDDGDAYRRLVIRDRRLVGAVGVGPWPESSRLQELVERRGRVWRWQRERFRRCGRLWRAQAPAPVADWPAQAIVCNCVGVRRGQLSAARAKGCATVDQLARATGASTVCGSCKPLLAELLGAPAVAARAAGRRWLLLASFAALAFVFLIFALRPVPLAETVQGGWKIDLLWRDGFMKRVTGFTLLGVTLISLLLSARKRVKRFNFGEFGLWRALHAGLGALTLVVLVTHTGFRLGHNLNFVLMANFLALALAGALTGGVTALERQLSPRNARRWRACWTGLHILLFWPFPVLVLFHALAAFYF
ncbi:MAG: FAD-dependent oxidoreductase [Verrucomicrobiales bacterium]|nr:FAD-dependent oxidoreductase [Verrucomicrobiales bacterium]